MSVAAPPRTHDERLESLRHANEVRTLRATLKRQMTRDRAVLTVQRPPEYAATMPVLDVILAVPRIGPARAVKMLNRCRVSHSKTLAGLSERQRREIAQELDA